MHDCLYILSCLLLGMIEMALSFGDLEYLNNHGTRSSSLIVLTQLSVASRKTLSRLLLLITSLGYGIVKYVIFDIFLFGISLFFMAFFYCLFSFGFGFSFFFLGLFFQKLIVLRLAQFHFFVFSILIIIVVVILNILFCFCQFY